MTPPPRKEINNNNNNSNNNNNNNKKKKKKKKKQNSISPVEHQCQFSGRASSGTSFPGKLLETLMMLKNN